MKKRIYLLAVIILMTMISFVIHMLAMPELINSPDTALCMQSTIRSLPYWVVGTILVTGIVFGYLIGQRRRDIVYVQRKHRWFKRQDAKRKK